MKREICIVVCLTVVGCASASAMKKLSAQQSPRPNGGVTEQPNIILIMADDLGKECIGAYGCTEYKTPVLDRMAEEGIRFRNCFSQPICTPSRVQIMTGKYNHRNYAGFGLLPTSEKTFGNLLRDAGYKTCIAGKWQLGGDMNTPDHFGFDEYCLWFLYPPENQPGGTHQGRRYWEPYRFWENGKMKEVSKDAYGPDLVCDYLVNYIERQKADEPFFIYFPMLLTHVPFDPTPDSPADAPREFAQWKYKQDTYLKDMVETMDKSVGRIVQILKKNGLAENTIILFVGDNGTDKVATTDTVDGPVKGGKGLMSDLGTHVPLIVRNPLAKLTTHVSDDLIDFSDFYPTLAELSGFPNIGKSQRDGGKVDGISFAPQLFGKEGTPREWVFSNYWKNGRVREGQTDSARDHRYRLYSDGRMYDVIADRWETRPLTDLSPEQAAAKKKLEAAIQQMRSGNN